GDGRPVAVVCQGHGRRDWAGAGDEGTVMATYYVDGASGSDGNPGNSGSPWATLRYAYSQAAAGDTVKVRTATYYEWLDINKTGLIFEADTGHTPTINGRYSPALFGAA